MKFEIILLIIIPIIFFATIIRSTFGFGDSLISMPLLSTIMSISVVTPLVALVAFSIALLVLLKNLHHVNFRSIIRLIISTTIGIPIGIYFLKTFDENLIKIILGCIISIFALYNLLKPKMTTITNDRFAYLFGLIAGILGGSYNINGPPVVFYSTFKRWPPESIQATLHGYFFSSGILIIIYHYFLGNFSIQVLKYYIIFIPVIIVAITIGEKLSKKIDKDKFIGYIYILIIFFGIILIVDII